MTLYPEDSRIQAAIANHLHSNLKEFNLGISPKNSRKGDNDLSVTHRTLNEQFYGLV